MRRKHRLWHLRLWLILGPLIAVMAIAALLVRPGDSAGSTSTQTTEAAP